MVKRLPIAKDVSTQRRRNADRNSILQQANTRLPKLEMATFKGDVLSFPSCWELSDANINSLTTLTSVQKFSYPKTTLDGEPSTLIANLEMTAANYNSALEILKDRYGDKQLIIEAHYRKLLNLDSKTERYTHLKQFFDNLELHIRGLEAQNKKKEEFGDLLNLLLMDKLSGDLRRCLSRDHRKTTWTIDDFLTALKRELQVMEQDKPKEINSNLQPHSTAAFYTDLTQSSRTQQNWIRNEGHMTKEISRSVLSVDHHIAPATAQNTSTLMIASK